MSNAAVRWGACGALSFSFWTLISAASIARAADPASHRDAGRGGEAVKPSAPPVPVLRRALAGTQTPDTSLSAAISELKALRDAELELFPPAAPALGRSGPADLPLVLPRGNGPHLDASGLPSAEATAPDPFASNPGDMAWLSTLELPDIPVRWDARVVRYLVYFRDDPRGHRTYEQLYQHSGRFREMIQRALRRKSLPEDLVWVAMIESGFDPAARSAAAAVGLWQFTADTGRVYGLSVDRWLDQRFDPELSTEAAANFLADLHRRFGAWELALAAYDMGYAGLLSVVLRYNTNDFWSLARTEGTLPWETTLYVPKIMAAAIVAHNLSAFGFGHLTVDPPAEPDRVRVPAGVLLSTVARAAGCTPKDVQALNPELRAGRTPPAGERGAVYLVKVPVGRGAIAARALARMGAAQPLLDRYVVSFGETLDQVAAAHKTTTRKLIEVNDIAPGEAIRGGTVLLVPRVAGKAPRPAVWSKVDASAVRAVAMASASGPSSGKAGINGKAGQGGRSGGDWDPPAVRAPWPASAGGKPTVVVPCDVFEYPDRKRVFYRVKFADHLEEIAASLHVSVGDLDRWNDIDPGAHLQDRMTLQAFVPSDVALSRVVVVPESEVTVLPVGSDEFFAALEKDRNFRRLTVAAQAGDTVETIGRRYGVPAGTMERINRRPRREVLREGETVVVYVPNRVAAGMRNDTAALASPLGGPVPNGPLPQPPIPDLLP